MPGYRHCERHLKTAIAKLETPPPGKWADQLNQPHSLQADKHFLTVDAEFTNLSESCPMAWSVCIRRFVNSEIIIHCNINYDGKDFDRWMVDGCKYRGKDYRMPIYDELK